ncbi:MAG: hypothetical protein HUK22_04715, partial [Thermoguttaceae bacterium]|nr:hypothetical protein [Thermoguttaceae bacterium]
MKKTIAFAALTFSALVGVGFAQDGQQAPNRPQGAFGFLRAARTEDGKVDLSKLPEQMPQERKDAIKAADKDGDGFLTPEELRAAFPRPEG